MTLPVTPFDFVVVTSALFCCGMLAPLWRRRGVELALALALAGSIYALAGACLFVWSPTPTLLQAPTRWADTRLPVLPWELRIDRLAAFFILLIAALVFRGRDGTAVGMLFGAAVTIVITLVLHRAIGRRLVRMAAME